MKFAVLCFISGLCIWGNDGLEIRPLPYGVASEALGEARIFREAIDLVVVRHHPSILRQRFTGTIRRQTEQLLQLATQHGDSSLGVYSERYSRLLRAGRTGRAKRNVLGDRLRWLTGTATLEDVRAIKDTVEGVTSQLQAQGVVLRGAVACLQADREEMATMAEKTQELVDVINSQSRELYNLSATLEDLYSVTFELQLKLTLENTLSYLEMFEQELKQYDALFRYHRDLDI